MRTSLLIFFFTLVTTIVSSQAMRIIVHEKTTDGSKPIADTKFELTLNDTLKTELTSASDGILGKLPVEPGVYKLVLTNPHFQPSETKNIVVSDKKLTILTVTCVPVSGNRDNDKKKPHSK